jgi:hypothetical protein
LATLTSGLGSAAGDRGDRGDHGDFGDCGDCGDCVDRGHTHAADLEPKAE